MGNKELFDNLGIDTTIGYEDGGYLKTKIGMNEMLIFFCKKNSLMIILLIMDMEILIMRTIKCILQDKPYYHIGPYYENPNFDITK